MGTESAIGGAPKIAFVTSLTELATTDKEGAGTVRTDQYGQKYRWVKNKSDDAAKAGAPACFDASDVAASFLQEVVTEDLATADEWFLAGVFISAIAGGGWGWIMIEGKYDTARLEVTAAVQGAVLAAKIETDVTGIGLDGMAYCFTPVAAAGYTGGADEIDWVANPHAVLLDTVATGSLSAATVPASASIWIKGLGA